MLFALSDSSSIELEGTSGDLKDLSRRIKDCETTCTIPLSVPARFDDRGLHYLQELVVRVDSDSLSISEADQRLSIAGAKEKLDLFLTNIDWLVESQANRDHIHVEFYPGHFFLAEDALPLVLVRQD